MPIRYTFINDPNTTRQNDTLSPCPRVMTFDTKKFPIEPSYPTLEELKKNDLSFLSFKSKNGKLAETICLKEHIIESKDAIFTQDYADVNGRNARLVIHTICGNRKRKDYTGIHYIDTPQAPHIKNFEIIKPENKQGVYVAKFLIVKNNDRVLYKDDPSSLFPQSWSMQQVYDECNYALDYQIQVDDKFYKSTTRSGIPVEIRYDKNWKLMTIYPLWIDDETNLPYTW